MPIDVILDTVQSNYETFSAYAKQNPVIAGAITLWGLTVLTMMTRVLPLRIFNFLRRQLTTTLTFTNQNTGHNMETFSNFLAWFHTNPWAKYSRQIAIDGTRHDTYGSPSRNGAKEDPLGGTTLGPGIGSHFFMFKRWPYWMQRSPMANAPAGAHQINYQITITTFGRNRDRILKLIEEFRYVQPPDSLCVYGWGSGGWDKLTDITRRKLSTVIIKEELKDKLIERIDTFLSSEDWYRERGLPYKLTILLHGPTGGGKTSLIKALASHYSRNVAQMTLLGVTDETIYRAFANAPENSFIAIEDIDSSTATHQRAALKERPDREKRSGHTTEGNYSDGFGKSNSLSLSGLLNALDGLASLNGQIIFLSTNIPDELDDALKRKGRVDLMLEIPSLEQKEIQKYITLMFPDADVSDNVHFSPIMGCDLQELYFEHRFNVDDFIRAIPKPVEHCEIRLVHSTVSLETKVANQ